MKALNVVGRSGPPERRHRPRDRPDRLHGRPRLPRDASSQDGPQPAPSCADPEHRPVRRRAGARLRPRPDRAGRAAQRLHDPGAHRRRAGRGVRAAPRSASGSRARRSRPSSPRPRRPRWRPSPRVRLDLEELPAVFDVEEALKPGAPIVTHWGNNTFMYEGHPCRRVRLGDVEAGVRARRTTSSRASTTRARSSTPRPRRPAASPCPRPTAGPPSTRTPRRSTSASTTPRSSCRSPATGSTSWAAP